MASDDDADLRSDDTGAGPVAAESDAPGTLDAAAGTDVPHPDEAALPDDAFVAPSQRIASGFWHSCALDPDGLATCWGRSETPTDLDHVPGSPLHFAGQAQAPRDMRFRAIAAGAFHTCAIRADDATVQCWGDDRHGEATPPGSRFASIDAGIGLSCGVRADGSLLCWGRHADALDLPPGQDFVQVVVGTTWNDYPHNDVCALRKSGRVECVTTLQPPFESRRGPFVQIALASASLCGLHADGRVECWRCPALQCIERDEGQTTPPADTRFSSLVANNLHACGVGADDGVARCWGHPDARLDAPPGALTELSAGWFHTCGLDKQGRVRCWGSDRGGQSSPAL